MMTIKKVAEILSGLEVETPKTYCFDNQKDEKGNRKYGQKTRRWWDEEGIRGQQDHVVAYFICRYYNDTGYQSECEKKCASCYPNKEYTRDNPLGDYLEASDLYNKRISTPEMYIWIIEALEILDDKELEELIKKIKLIMEEENDHNSTKISEIRNDLIKEYAPWEIVEEKLKELASKDV